MQKIPDQYRNLPSAKRLGEAWSEFDAAASALAEANLSARAKGKRITAEMHECAKQVSIAREHVKTAEAEFDLAIGGPTPIELTPLVTQLVRYSFFADQQSEVIRLLEKECVRNRAFGDDASLKHLERIRLAIVKTAGGTLAGLHRQLEIAKIDWRDVINSAEYPEATKLTLLKLSTMEQDARGELAARDRQQYLAWLSAGEVQQSSTDLN